MAQANDEFLKALEELWPFIKKSSSQDMGNFLASCINSEADDESIRKITKVMREHIEAWKVNPPR